MRKTSREPEGLHAPPAPEKQERLSPLLRTGEAEEKGHLHLSRVRVCVIFRTCVSRSFGALSGAVSIFGFYPVGCNVINTAVLEIRRGHCSDLVSYHPLSSSSSSPTSPMSLGLSPRWTEAELLVRERAKDVPMACRELGVWERQGDLASAMSRDRIPDGLEWWGGGGNKDIDLDQGTLEEKRNRVEIQYKIPPETTVSYSDRI